MCTCSPPAPPQAQGRARQQNRPHAADEALTLAFQRQALGQVKPKTAHASAPLPSASRFLFPMSAAAVIAMVTLVSVRGHV